MDRTPLETPRLHLRPREADDCEDLVALDLDLRSVRYIFPDGPPEPDALRRRHESGIAAGWLQTGGFWIVEWKERRGMLGWCALFPLEDSGFIEIGYRYLRKAWGQGVASEAAAVVLAHGFDALAIDPIVGVTHPDNRASQRVLEKVGLVRDGTAFHYGHDLPFFRLDRAGYEQRKAEQEPV